MELKITVKAPWDCPELTTFGMKYSAAKPTAPTAPTPMPYLSHLKRLGAGLGKEEFQKVKRFCFVG